MGYKLLLADDSTTIQKLVGIIFSGEGYDLTVVDNGDDALRKARQSTPDLMLIDVQMPGKDGYHVCREARKDPTLSDIPILLLTGVFDPFDESSGQESGADDFIAKPFEAQVLIDKVADLLTLGAMRRVPILEEPTASPMEVEVLEIEEVTALDDPWGMRLVKEEQACEIPFGTVILPEEGDSLEDFEELEPFVVEEEADGLRTLTETDAGNSPGEIDTVVAMTDAEPVVQVSAAASPVIPEPASVAAGNSVQITEELLVAALTKVSRETIERIVWEVVPDLAEVLVKEEIRKIRSSG